MTRKEVRLSDIIIPKYQPLVNDHTHMHKIMTSGRAGTKSSFMAILVIFSIVSIPKTAVIVMRKHHNKLRKTVYKECIRAIHRLGLSKKRFEITKSPMQITYKRNGNTVYFTGSDSIDDTKGIIDEERSIRMVVLDELTEFFDKGEGEDEINNIVATFVRGNNDFFQMLYLFNPPKNPKAPVNQWTNTMAQRPDCVHVHADYRDVPQEWLGKALIQEALNMAQVDEKMYRWVWLGEAVGLDDLIYYMFQEEHIKEPNKHFSFYVIGVDYGQMNATTFEAYGIDTENKCLQGLEEFYHSGRETGKQKSPNEYAKEMRKLVDEIYKKYGKGLVYITIDPSAKGLAEEIKRVCPDCKIKDAKNDVKLGISRVQKLLIYKRLFFSSSQKMLKEEIYQYAYDEDSIEKGDEKPIKVNDHCMDAMRYAVMGAWKHMKVMLPFLNDGKE